MTIKYRTRETGTDYTFDFVRLPTTWRIDIVAQPSYNGRASDAHSTHRLGPEGARYICWDSPITTIDQAKAIAANWAEGTDRYIRTGNSTAAFTQGGWFLDFGEAPDAQQLFERLGRTAP